MSVNVASYLNHSKGRLFLFKEISDMQRVHDGQSYVLSVSGDVKGAQGHPPNMIQQSILHMR